MIVDGDDMDLNVQRTYMVSNIGMLYFAVIIYLEHTKSKLIVDPKTN